MGNYSLSYRDTLPCHNDTNQCYHPFAQILDGVNCLSIILNILHLVILNQMKEIKTTKYFFILVNFGISDIIFSSMHRLLIGSQSLYLLELEEEPC